MSVNHNIIVPLYRFAQTWPDKIAITAGQDKISGQELATAASRLAGYLHPRLNTRRVGILASRSIAAYIGIAGAAWAGATYVPLNLKWPAERLIKLLGELELDALIVDKNGAALLTTEVLQAAPADIIHSDDAEPFANIGHSNSVSFANLNAAPMPQPAFRAPEDLGYIVFTSGSTGQPKGVMVSCSSLSQYLDETEKWTQFTPADRIAEAHDITFDLSVHNMFLAWRAGSSLHLMTALDMMAPQAFIRKNDISVWMSVPTIVNNMRRSGALKPDLFPKLRLSVFCGEPLAIPTIEAWAEAAPNSVIENIYGPTECTVVCTRQRLTSPPLITESRGILSIGDAYDNFEINICDRQGAPLPDGEVGEIALASPQLSDGYFNAPEQTAASFRTIAGKRWYYTGDRGYRDEQGKLHHMGRTDNQVKVKGNRIELEEVETHLRKASKTELATVVAWPVVDGSPQGLIGFTTNRTMKEDKIRSQMAKNLPDYMIPRRIIQLEEMPRNINDKIDRKRLLLNLELANAAPSVETPAGPAVKKSKNRTTA